MSAPDGLTASGAFFYIIMTHIKHILAGLVLASASHLVQAATPVYLDDTKPIEERVEDALSRMTLREKINIIHAQSKFSAPGVPRLGIPELWCTDGPMGVRPEVYSKLPRGAVG